MRRRGYSQEASGNDPAQAFPDGQVVVVPKTQAFASMAQVRRDVESTHAAPAPEHSVGAAWQTHPSAALHVWWAPQVLSVTARHPFTSAVQVTSKFDPSQNVPVWLQTVGVTQAHAAMTPDEAHI
jgi:hypothetical protein